MGNANSWLCADVALGAMFLLLQGVLLMHGMIRVTAPSVYGNTFYNIVPLWAATVPLLGFLVARRRVGLVRRLSMRLHAVTCATTAVSLLWDAVVPFPGAL